jgi:hypothetical protein
LVTGYAGGLRGRPGGCQRRRQRAIGRGAGRCSGAAAGHDPGTALRRDSGLGTVIGVIGGYQQGGATEAISYAAVPGPRIAALYRAATVGA